MEFNKVVFRHVGRGEQNIHIAVHPFPCNDGLRMMSYRQDYGNLFKDELVEWKKGLADALWDGIPGLSRLFFSNGSITLQHEGVFTDVEILEEAEAIIRPILQAQLVLSQMWTENTEPPEEDYWGRPDL